MYIRALPITCVGAVYAWADIGAYNTIIHMYVDQKAKSTFLLNLHVLWGLLSGTSTSRPTVRTYICTYMCMYIYDYVMHMYTTCAYMYVGVVVTVVTCPTSSP